jgi:hypothetical protein
MSFQAYMNAVEKKTGMPIADLTAIARDKGFVNADGTAAKGVKAGDIIAWLKADYGVGHGHAMSVWALFSGLRKIGEP